MCGLNAKLSCSRQPFILSFPSPLSPLWPLVPLRPFLYPCRPINPLAQDLQVLHDPLSPVLALNTGWKNKGESVINRPADKDLDLRWTLDNVVAGPFDKIIVSQLSVVVRHDYIPLALSVALLCSRLSLYPSPALPSTH